MRWRRFQHGTHNDLSRAFGVDRVLHEPTFPSGLRPDHVVLRSRGSRIKAIVDSKDKARLTHSDVDQVVAYRAEAGMKVATAFAVPERTEMSRSVADRIDAEGIELLVRGVDESDDEEISPDQALAAGMLAVGVGGIAHELAKRNGSANPGAWGLGMGLLTLFAATR